MPYFYVTLSGGGVIEADTLDDAKKIIHDHASCYSTVIGGYECNKDGIDLETERKYQAGEIGNRFSGRNAFNKLA